MNIDSRRVSVEDIEAGPVLPLNGRTPKQDRLVKLTVILSLVLGARYMYWRWTETFNPAHPTFWWTWILAESELFLSSLLFYATTWRVTRYTPEPPLPRRNVDVFIATYNEPVELLRDTVMAATAIEYPHRTVILDDGNRPEVAALARELACDYLPREVNTHAKAGNLNNGLANSTAEFVVTLDADHVASPTLIDDMLGYFKDPGIAGVQANQDFYNLDSFQHVVDWKRSFGWQFQELFFGVSQPGKDALNAVVYCGSPAMLRRTAVDEIGGIATGTVTEDLHTGMRLHHKGWRILYLNKSVARGLSPQTFVGFETQWKRWGIGAMQVFRKEKILLHPGLTMWQRLAYVASIEYNLLFSWAKGIAICTVIFALFTGIFPLLATPDDFLWMYVPHLLATIWAGAALTGAFVSPLLTERYNVVKLLAQLDAFTGYFRRNAKFVVTPKTISAATRISSGWVYVLILGLLYGGTMVGVSRMVAYRGQSEFWAYAVATAFAAFYFWVIIPGVARAVRRKEERVYYRFPGGLELPVRWEAFALSGSGATRLRGETYARNANRYGLSITVEEDLPPGTFVSLDFELDGRPIRALAEVRRTFPFQVDNATKFANGLRFVDLKREDADLLARHLFTTVAPRHGDIMRITAATQGVGEAA